MTHLNHTFNGRLRFKTHWNHWTLVLLTQITSGITFHPTRHRTKKQIFCHRCGEAGHYRNECFRFKTRICRHFEKGFCRDGSQCPFAHGESEIRNPGIPRCVHVSYDNKGNVQFRGCMEYGHSYENCTHSGGTE